MIGKLKLSRNFELLNELINPTILKILINELLQRKKSFKWKSWKSLFIR